MAFASKFHDIDHYSSEANSQYKLLPFNFIRVEDSKYLLTNIVGEYIILKRSDIERLVHKEVLFGSELYNELKAKNFICSSYNDSSVQLLSMKYRTRNLSVKQFTSLHIFVVSLRCDYSCPYCQVSRKNTKESVSKFDMTEATAEKGLEFAFKSPSKFLKIEFQGGEPLLNFDMIKYICNRAVEINKEHKKNIEFVIATNLTYATDEVLDFCAEMGIYISTSLDGPEYLHNKNRPRPDKNGHQLTVDAIKRIQLRLGYDRVSALMTTTKESFNYHKEIIDEYLRLGFNSIFLRPLSPYGFAIKTNQIAKYNNNDWFEFYKAGLEYVFEINKSGYNLAEQYTSIIAKKILTNTSPGYVDLQSPTGAGLSAIAYNYDGNIYISDEARMLSEMGDEKFKLGNLHIDSFEDVFTSDKFLDILEDSLTESSPMCSDCGYQPYCGSDPVYHYATQGDHIGNKSISGFCDKNMKLFSHIIEILNKDGENASIIRRWVGQC